MIAIVYAYLVYITFWWLDVIILAIICRIWLFC